MSSRLIDEKSEQHIRKLFSERLTDDVDVTFYAGQENEDAVTFTRQFLTELAALSERIELEEKPLDEAARSEGLVSPSLVLGRKKGYRVEVHGAPSGHEAGALIETLPLIAAGETGLSPASLAKLAEMDREVLLYSFVTPTCPHCPGSVLQNHRIAVAAPGKVRSVAVSAGENLELARRFDVSSVPQQVINEDPESATLGVQPESRYVDQILQYGSSDPEAVLAAAGDAAAEKEKLVDDPDFPLTLTDANFREAIEKYPFLVVDCWAEWCGPCRMIAPVVAELAAAQAGRMVFGKLDTEANAVVPTEFDIRSIPTLLVFKNGELAERLVGAMPKDELLAKLETML
jgi:thioredoxin 1